MTYKAGQDIKLYKKEKNVRNAKKKNGKKSYSRFSFPCRHHDVDSDQDIIDHVQAQFDSMSREQFLQMVYYDPKLDPVLNEAIEILDAQLSQLQQHQIPQIQQQPQVQQLAQEQQQITIPENLNNENDNDNPMDRVLSIRKNITLQIPHGLRRDPEIHENNRSSFNRDQ